MLAWIRARPASVRLVVLKFERSPARLVSRLRGAASTSSSTATANTASSSSTSTSTTTDTLRNIEPTALLDAVSVATRGEKCHTPFSCTPHSTQSHSAVACSLLRPPPTTHHPPTGEIAPLDFVPLSVAQAAEPLLSMLGYGTFALRPSPYCYFATLLLNTKEHVVRGGVLQLPANDVHMTSHALVLCCLVCGGSQPHSPYQPHVC